ncbi:ubiquinol-cytochrome c reductase iron-sulfur subunit [Actinoplanes subtropicus]|uniref:QcrA and Rieske domain-containing protein n=1 Tax=Actinoplanes subtropicus TaxID=543632 RepID=UPI0004C4478B|nr:Rieske 2Fe-2S domain-containing protein [Actinoplanes subtropicus]
MREFSRYVDRLIRRRRPQPFVMTAEEAEAVRAAIAIRAATSDEQEPRPEFIAGLRERVAGSAETFDPPRVTAPRGRRTFLIGTSAAAAAAAVAVAADRTLGGGPERPAVSTALDPADGGSWHRVLASSDLPGDGVVGFETDVVSGFVMRISGVLSARSGTCTHQGCRLGLNAPEKRLACPCHRTSFAYDGTVIRSQLPNPPAPLPSFHVREVDGEIQILLPRE